MLTRNTRYILMLLSFAGSTQAFAASINIFCYYLAGNKEQSFLLHDATDKPVQIEANFSADISAFVVHEDALSQVELDCRRVAGEKGFNFDNAKGATTLSGWLYQSYLGFLGKHYRLVRDRSVPLEMAAAKDVFTHLADMQFSEHPYLDDPTEHLKRFKTKSLDVITSKEPLAPFIEDVLSKDFLRSNFLVLHAGQVKYGHKLHLLWDLAQRKFSRPLEAPEQLFEQIFAAIENAVDGETKAKIGEVQLRKNIALALATRTQTFEFVPLNRVHLELQSRAQEHALTLISSGMGRIDNIVTVEGHTLVLESNSGINVQLVQDGTWDVGLYLCHREMRMNLLTGEMTPETVKLTQFMML